MICEMLDVVAFRMLLSFQNREQVTSFMSSRGRYLPFSNESM